MSCRIESIRKPNRNPYFQITDEASDLQRVYAAVMSNGIGMKYIDTIHLINNTATDAVARSQKTLLKAVHYIGIFSNSQLSEDHLFNYMQDQKPKVRFSVMQMPGKVRSFVHIDSIGPRILIQALQWQPAKDNAAAFWTPTAHAWLWAIAVAGVKGPTGPNDTMYTKRRALVYGNNLSAVQALMYAKASVDIWVHDKSNWANCILEVVQEPKDREKFFG